MKKIDGRKISRSELAEKRRQVIKLHNDKVPVMQIVRICGLSWPAVNAAITRYNADQSLEPELRGRKQGTGRLLSKEHEDEIQGIIYRKQPWQVGFRHPQLHHRLYLWNRDVVKELIHQKTDLSLSTRGVANYLRRWGFPMSERPIKRCKKKMRAWLLVNNESLKQRSVKEFVETFWLTRIPLAIDHTSDQSFPKKLSMISATDIRGKEHWLIVEGNFTKKIQIRFLQAVAKNFRKNLILIRTSPDHYKAMGVSSLSNQDVRRIEIFPPDDFSDISP